MQCSENAVDFIDEALLTQLSALPTPDAGRVREIIAKSLEKQALSVEETALLAATEDPALVEEIFEAARTLKRNVYGNRIVLFAPLYIGNDCVNDCTYCSFKRSHREQVRRTLTMEELRGQVEALENVGHKRLIIVFGEHPRYDAEYIAECVREIYQVRTEHGEIRRVNVNAAPFDIEGFRTIKAANIGTYQIFMETYHHGTFAEKHNPTTRKSNYLWRLDALSRAMEAGIDDVGIGALFGLTEWKFDLLGLVSHALFLQKTYGVGPHTISFPRLQPAAGVDISKETHLVDDASFKRLIAVLRLAVPYTGLICTARESADVRRAVMDFGVSQIDAGTRLELGGYTESGDAQVMEREQFRVGDIRPLDVVIRELLQDGYVPSFCTSCYRLGRTGEHFMEFSIPGFIKRFCTPNALTTLQEYLVDYASPETRAEGEKMVAAELAKLPAGPARERLAENLRLIREEGRHDLYE
jgi:2-iminoacetate synthase